MKTISKIVLACLALALVGCQPSADMIRAEIAYYSAISDTIKAQGNGNKPLLEIVAKDASRPMVFDNVERIVVYNTPQPTQGPLIPQYRQVDYSAPWTGVVSGIGAGLLGVGGIWAVTHEYGKWQSGTNYNMYGQGSQVKIQGGTTANATMSGSGNLGQIGPTDATSVPTVVKPEVVFQPEPVVVTP